MKQQRWCARRQHRAASQLQCTQGPAVHVKVLLVDVSLLSTACKDLPHPLSWSPLFSSKVPCRKLPTPPPPYPTPSPSYFSPPPTQTPTHPSPLLPRCAAAPGVHAGLAGRAQDLHRPGLLHQKRDCTGGGTGGERPVMVGEGWGSHGLLRPGVGGGGRGSHGTLRPSRAPSGLQSVQFRDTAGSLGVCAAARAALARPWRPPVCNLPTSCSLRPLCTLRMPRAFQPACRALQGGGADVGARPGSKGGAVLLASSIDHGEGAPRAAVRQGRLGWLGCRALVAPGGLPHRPLASHYCCIPFILLYTKRTLWYTLDHMLLQAISGMPL